MNLKWEAERRGVVSSPILPVQIEVVTAFGGWPVVIIVFSFLFSTIIWLFFGWYPAKEPLH